MKRKAVLVISVLLMAALLTACGDGGKYKKAMSLYESGSYEEAAAIFAELGDYEDSAERLQDCQYQNASALRSSGDLEKALGIFESLLGYKDADIMAEEVRHDIMLQTYGDVIALLQDETWFFNGGNDTTLNCLTFSDTAAVIQQVYFDGNGKYDNGSTENPYVIDADNVVLTLASGEELSIPYTMSDGTVKLGSGDYFMQAEVQDGLQGFWMNRGTSTLLGETCANERWIHFDGETVSMESASEASTYFYEPGSWFYYGPYEGTYTLNVGGIDTEMEHGDTVFFNIIDGNVAVLWYDAVMTRSDAEAFPGENGYSF